MNIKIQMIPLLPPIMGVARSGLWRARDLRDTSCENATRM